MTRGLVLGKFLPYHLGHAHLIRAARAQVDELVVLVCSLPDDPIPGSLRYRWVRASHPDCRVVHVTDAVPQTPAESPDFWPIWVELVARHAGPVDVVFTSEDYGDALARRLGARHVLIDRARAAVPTSGAAIRRDPMAHWAFLPPVVRPWFVRRVVLVGSESVGKTTLARHLAATFDTAWVEEYGRAYCEHRDALALRLPDFEAIVWGQATWEDDAAERANRVLVCDTELLTTCVWSDIVTGARPAWITDAARGRRYDLVLFLEAGDVPWVADGTRVLEDRRDDLATRLRAELDAAGWPYVRLVGTFTERERAAEALVRELLGPSGSALPEAAPPC